MTPRDPTVKPLHDRLAFLEAVYAVSSTLAALFNGETETHEYLDPSVEKSRRLGNRDLSPETSLIGFDSPAKCIPWVLAGPVRASPFHRAPLVAAAFLQKPYQLSERSHVLARIFSS